jgi:hypothetical protein
MHSFLIEKFDINFNENKFLIAPLYEHEIEILKYLYKKYAF